MALLEKIVLILFFKQAWYQNNGYRLIFIFATNTIVAKVYAINRTLYLQDVQKVIE